MTFDPDLLAGLENCVRVSASHYNTRAEIEQMLATVTRLAGS